MLVAANGDGNWKDKKFYIKIVSMSDFMLVCGIFCKLS